MRRAWGSAGLSREQPTHNEKVGEVLVCNKHEVLFPAVNYVSSAVAWRCQRQLASNAWAAGGCKQLGHQYCCQMQTAGFVADIVLLPLTLVPGAEPLHVSQRNS
jgi:hypothetical protein